MNRHIRYMSMLSVTVLLLFTTGCWSSNEIEDLSVYVGLGLDVAKESKFEQNINQQGASYPKRKVLTATVQIVPPIAGKNEKQSGSAPSSPSKAYLNEQLTGDSLIQIFRQFSLRRDRPLIGHHLKVIVISSELARKYSLEQVLDFILRDNDIRPSCLIVVSHRSALEALSSTEPGEIPAFYLTGLVDNRYRSNKILPPMSLIKLDSTMQSGKSFLLQNVVTAQSEHKFSGAAIFNGNTKKWIGELSQYEVEGISWIKEDVVGGALKTYTAGDGHSITYEPKNSHSSIIPKVHGDDISFHIKIHSEGRFIEDWSFPEIPTTEQYMRELEQQFEEEARKQIGQALDKMQHVYHVDVGGFGEKLRIKHPGVWRKVKDHWDETFSHVPITYEVHMKITDFGSSID
ncbi:spore germination protein [Paenibacillus sp. cl141a]|nr:spore germination protein [Paenibacillus sp. cl141a]